ncbi:hypothetical protein MY5147_007726 [Beauveria neobassiana]
MALRPPCLLLLTDRLVGSVTMRQRRLALLAAPILCFFFLSTSLYYRREQLSRLKLPFHFDLHGYHDRWMTPPATVVDGAVLSSSNISTYIDSIFKPTSTALPRLECPALDRQRYASLQAPADAGREIQYYFALALRNCLSLLPRLMGSLVQVINFLGPNNCALSIVQGNSPDGTADILNALKGNFEAMGVTYHINTSSLDPLAGDRIEKLAELRNMALRPLLREANRVTDNTTVIFLNDVAACAEDILELVHQRRNLGADMTCGMDWTYVGRDPTFYDVWVARGINGDTFFDIPPDGNWNSAWNLFWNAHDTQTRYSQQRPFQVFACWNGAAVFSAKPILEGLRFRTANTDGGECTQGEPQLFCKDMWFRGYGKIAVIPTVNLEYSDERAKQIKDLKGYASKLVSEQDPANDVFAWQQNPPDEVKCMPVWENQFWQKWDEGLS